MILNGRVFQVDISRYGKKLINELDNLDFSKHERHEVPLFFSFNSSWKIEHVCLACAETVTIDQNFDENESTLSIVKNLNSANYSRSIIEEIAAVFETIEPVEIDDVLYLNRTDFQYDFNFQRKSSVDVSHYCCQSCNADYLALIRVGFPMAAERGMEDGQVGRVEVTEMVMVDSVNELKH